MIETAEYGPFSDGYVASVDRTAIGRNAFSEDSLDCAVDPETGEIINRGGSAVRFDTAGALVGLLEAKWSARVRQFLQLESESFADGQPNIAGLWTQDTNKEGQLWFRSTNGAGTNQVLGKSYGIFHRSKTNVTVWNFVMIPLHTEHATDKWTRCKSIAQRKVLFSGSRKVLRVGKGLVAPNRFGTPLWWNGRFNDDPAAGTEREYIRPLGPMPPIFPIQKTGISAAAATTGTWLGRDKAYWSYAYQYENGDVSAPYLCSAGDAINVDLANPTIAYAYVSLFIPPGPPDCVARLIFRTNKWDASLAAGTLKPTDSAGMLLTGVIRNNLQTAYNDFGGDDASLRARPDLIRYDLIMPPKARSVFTMDNRIVFCDLAINTAVIELAPYAADSAAVPASLAGYIYSQASAYGNTWSYWRIDGANLTLKQNVGGVWAAAVTGTTIALAGLTLGGLVDAINAVVPAIGAYPWRAQLLPGVDRNALALDLETTTGSDYFDDDGGAPGTAGASDGTAGNQRVISGQTLPGVMYMKKDSPWATGGTDPRGLHFTTANPAGTGTEADAPLGPNAWRGGFDCRRRLEGGMGRMIGGCSLLDGALVIATNGIAVLRNVRGGKTGVDTDYRLEKWKTGSGGIAWGAHAEGDGWGVYTSRKGIMVNDGKREVCVSKRVWNPRANHGSGRGPWAYEFGQCKKWVAANDDSCHLHVSVAHGRIYVAYRSSAAVTYPDRYMYYDFTASLNEIGVDQVLREDGSPFPWSAPINIRGSQMATVTRDDGDHLYTGVDDLGAGHATGDGTAVEAELAAVDDDGVTSPLTAYLQTDRFGSLQQKKCVTAVEVEYYDPDSGALQMHAATDFARTTDFNLANLPVVTDGTVSGVWTARPGQIIRGPVNTFEIKILATPLTKIAVRHLVVRFRRLRTLNPT